MKRFRNGQERESRTIRTALDAQPAKLLRALQRSTAFTGGWYARRSSARSRRTGRRQNGSNRRSGRRRNTSSEIQKRMLQSCQRQREGRRGRELGWARRNWLVLVPEVRDLASLNQQILTACALGRERTIMGRSLTVGQARGWSSLTYCRLAKSAFPLRRGLSIDNRRWRSASSAF